MPRTNTPNIKSINKGLLQAFYFFLLILILFGTSKLANQQQNFIYEIQKTHFYSGPGSGHLNLLSLKKPALLVHASTSFEFTNKDPGFSYGNIFQTSSEANGIRLELQPGKKLFLITGNNRLHLIADHLSSNTPYKVSIQYDELAGLTVLLNEKLTLSLTPLQLGEEKLRIQNFSIGSGFALSRNFNGNIDNFSARVEYRQNTLLGVIFHWIQLASLLVALVLILLSLLRARKFGEISGLHKLSNYGFISWRNIQPSAEVSFLLYPISMGILAISIWSLQFFSGNFFGLSKWLPYVTIPFSLLIVCAPKWIGLEKSKSVFTALILASLFFYTGLLLFITLRLNGFNEYLLFFWMLSVCIIPFLELKHKAIFAVVCMASWITISSLENWIFLEGLLRTQQFPYFLLSGLVLIYLFSNQFLGKINSKTKVSTYLFAALGLPLFLYLSFRTDTLFIPGSEYHWEYFTGPIRSIRNGGWLLFNAPSQYGFFNILLASAIPIESSWQSLYFLQGLILFGVSAACLITLLSFSSHSFIQKISIFLLIAGSFFFADPHWIGPLPFPSSSVTRFFCCYLLIFSTLLPLKGIRKKIVISIAWCVGVFWSAESAFYCSSIYFFIIAADMLSARATEKLMLVIKTYFAIAFACLSTAIIFNSLFFFYKIGAFPNFISYFDYAIGYASGYGYVPFPVNGPGNLALLIYLGIGILLFNSIQQMKNEAAITLASLAGCIWAVGSYYLGRPVPQNITALFPVLAYCSLLAIAIAERSGLKNMISPLFAAAVPLFFLIMTTYYSPGWWQNLQHIQSFSSNISLHLPKASADLEKALNKIDPTNSIPVVIFSDSAAAPYSQNIISLKNEISWLPTPLQLLMPPIKTERQLTTLERFICHNFKQNGILIYEPGSISYAWPGFLQNLSRLLFVKQIMEIGDKKIFLFEKNSTFNSLCNPRSR